MLLDLRIVNLGVITEAHLDLGPGLTALTGETGAGKTMVTAGLGLLLAERTDASMIRHGAERASVEARFDQVDDLDQVVGELGGQLEDGELLVARQVNANGRSRAFVGGAGCTIAALGQVTSTLATIHGQSEQRKLASRDRQREVLDRYLGAEHQQRVREFTEMFGRHRALVAERDRLVASARERAARVELLQFGLSQIEAVDPQPSEDEQLRAEARRLEAMDDLLLAAGRMAELINGSDQDEAQPGAAQLLAQAAKHGDALVLLDEQAGELVERLRGGAVVVNDLAADLSSYLANLEADPARMAAVAARQAELAGLTRKYGEDVNEVLAWAERASAELLELDASGESTQQLTEQIDALGAELAERAAALTSARQQACGSLGSAIAQELAALSMPSARVVVQLDRLDRWGPYGADRVELLFAANPGAEPLPLGRVASGGELSRVRLAVEVILGEPGHTYVFDEVDAGIGGAVGLEVGRRLARLAEHSQVIVVTHLAQVAAFAQHHFVVEKYSDGEVTDSAVRLVDGAEREREIVRLMGGIEAGQSGRAHARDLLAQAQTKG